MVTLYRDEQVNTLSYNLNIPKSTVRSIITGYVEYVKSCLREGEPCKFLNIVKFRVNGRDEKKHPRIIYNNYEGYIHRCKEVCQLKSSLCSKSKSNG